MTDAARPAKPVASLGRSSGAIARRIAHDILLGTYAPGAVLPKEIDAAINFDVSRSGYREAICVLAAKGMIESRPKAGTRVCEREKWSLLDPDIQCWILETAPSPSFISSLFELRLIVEPAAAELAAGRRTDEDIRAMRSALRVMRLRTLCTEEGRSADFAFHRSLIRSARNEALFALSSSVEAAVNWTMRLKTFQQIVTDDPIPDHERILDAIERRDAGAAKWYMEALIRTAHDDTRRALSQY